MGNMSYCRFKNTNDDLQDCLEHLLDSDLSESEQRERKKLVEIAQQIVDTAENGGL